MARNYQDWDDLGRSIQEIVDRAVNSQDYRKLNQTIRQTVEQAVDAGGEAVRRAAQSGAARQQTVKQARAAVKRKELPVLYGEVGGKTAGGILQIVGGGILSFFTLMGSLAVSILGAVTQGYLEISLGPVSYTHLTLPTKA